MTPDGRRWYSYTGEELLALARAGRELVPPASRYHRSYRIRELGNIDIRDDGSHIYVVEQGQLMGARLCSSEV